MTKLFFCDRVKNIRGRFYSKITPHGSLIPFGKDEIINRLIKKKHKELEVVMYKIAIVEDEAEQSKRMVKFLKNYAKKKGLEIQ